MCLIMFVNVLGFLHALRLVEMTSNVMSGEVETSVNDYRFRR